MLDADNDPESRLRSVLSNLKNIGCADESTTLNEYNISDHNGLRLGIFISPGNSHCGTIETLILKEIQTKPEIECIETLKVCIESMYGEGISDKVLTQIYISLKKPGLCGTYRGFESGIFNADHPAYEQVVSTFTKL